MTGDIAGKSPGNNEWISHLKNLEASQISELFDGVCLDCLTLLRSRLFGLDNNLSGFSSSETSAISSPDNTHQQHSGNERNGSKEYASTRRLAQNTDTLSPKYSSINGELGSLLNQFTASRRWDEKGNLWDKDGNPPGIIRDEEVDPFPPLFKQMLSQMVRWHVLPPTCVPNSCIVTKAIVSLLTLIDHHDFLRPFCTFSFLTECNILFGSNLKVSAPGELSGPVSIPLPVGSVLVLKGNVADIAKHCVPAKRDFSHI